MKASRLARMLGMDRNPLRRGTDRVESWLTLVVTLALLVGGPLVVWQAGAAAYRGAAAAAARDQQSQHRYQITAVLRDDASKYVITNGDQSTQQGPVPARWTAPDGTTHDGAVIPPSAGDRSGDPVTISTDRQGNLTQPPPPADPMSAAHLRVRGETGANTAMLALPIGTAGVVLLAIIAVSAAFDYGWKQRRGGRVESPAS